MIPENATPKDYSLIIYNKTEIDDMIQITRDQFLDIASKKSDKVDEGSPSGMATLDVDGFHNYYQIPFATAEESMEADNTTTVMSPQKVQYVVERSAVSQDAIGADDGICPLGSDGIVNSSFLPPQRISAVYVVDTVDLMYDLPNTVVGGIFEGDRCVVTSDPQSTNNAEYIAETDNPTQYEWMKLPNQDAVSSVNGRTGAVDITSIAESAQNASDITNLSATVLDLGNDQDIIDGRLDQIDILNGNQSTAINDNDVDIGILSSLSTEAKNDLVSAVNEVDSNSDAIDARVATLEATDIAVFQYNFNSIEAFAVPDTYNTAPDVSVSILAAPAGNYVFCYSFVVNFNGKKDKALGFETTGTFSTGDEYSESSAAADRNNMKSRYYERPFVWAGGDLDNGIRFVDQDGGQGFTIVSSEAVIKRVG